jgi:sulfite reductase (NADPH) flavoprotein alpha-component
MVRDLIRGGGQVMVCGSQAMAADVAYVVSSAIQPLGLNLATLKSEGRYLEDVY